jgi:hypothetical protein
MRRKTKWKVFLSGAFFMKRGGLKSYFKLPYLLGWGLSQKDFETTPGEKISI